LFKKAAKRAQRKENELRKGVVRDGWGVHCDLAVASRKTRGNSDGRGGGTVENALDGLLVNCRKGLTGDGGSKPYSNMKNKTTFR